MDQHGLVDTADKIDWMRNWWRVWQVGMPAPATSSAMRHAASRKHAFGVARKCPGWLQPCDKRVRNGSSSALASCCLQSNLDNNCEEGEEGACRIVVS